MEELVICPKCHRPKPISQFNRILGAFPLVPANVRECKECNHERYMAKYATPSGRAAQNRASRNWKKANPERHAELAREYRKQHPEQIIAQNRLNYAIRKGRVLRQPCEGCGTTEKVHAHHVSYAPEDWYNVKWLCGVCHEIEHG